ncbi:MAG: NAD(P)-dependent alcohol dehydrogenase [Myxococcaceae bacterium]
MMMRAAMYDRYGPPEVLTLREVSRPEPREDEVRIAIGATTVTAACGMMRRGDSVMARLILGLFRPRRKFRIPGIELCGRVDAVGRRVTRFKAGDRVFGFTGFTPGACAEFLCLSEDASLALAPDSLSDDEAASLVDGPTTALYFLQGHVRAGTRLAIVGAAGSIGSAAVQVAHHLGAHVTGICSTKNLELVRQLGADDVVDYTREDFTSSNRRYEVVFDTVGKSSFTRSSRCLVDGGRYLTTVGGLGAYLLTLLTRWFARTRFVFGMSVDKRGALVRVTELVRTGALRTIIDRRFPLAEIAEAHRYVEQGHKRGNVVITVATR